MENAFKIKKGLIVTASGSTAVDIQGNSGQLFSITDSLTGVLMSVNDISGLPILEVSSDDTVKMGTFGAEGLIVSGSSLVFPNVPNAVGDLATITANGTISRRTVSQLLSDMGAQPALTNPVTGTGTTNFLSKFTGTSTLGNSLVFDNGTNIGIGTTSPTATVTITNTVFNRPNLHLRVNASTQTSNPFEIVEDSNGDIKASIDKFGTFTSSRYNLKNTLGVSTAIQVSNFSNIFTFGQNSHQLLLTSSQLFLDSVQSVTIRPGLHTYVNSKLVVNDNQVTPSASMHIKGHGTTSASSSLIVRNANNVNLLKIDDNRSFQIGPLTGNAAIDSFSISGLPFASKSGAGLYIGSTGALLLNLSGGNSTLSIRNTKFGFNVVPTLATIESKGQGNTDATSSMLLKNSSDTELFRVKDNGEVSVLGNLIAEAVSAILLNKEKIEVGQTLTIPQFYQYNLVNILINNGTIINNGALNIL